MCDLSGFGILMLQSRSTHPQNVVRLVGKRADRVEVERDLGAGHLDTAQ